MTDRIPAARIPAARTVDADNRSQPAPSRQDRFFMAAMWQILIAMGEAFVPPPPPVEFTDDDPHGSGWDPYDSGWDPHDPGWRDAR